MLLRLTGELNPHTELGMQTRTLPSVVNLQSSTHKNSSTRVSIGKGESVRRKHPPRLMSAMTQRIGGSACSPDFRRCHFFKLRRAPSESSVNRIPARRSEFCQAIKPAPSIRVAVPGSVKSKAENAGVSTLKASAVPFECSSATRDCAPLCSQRSQPRR